MNKSILWVTGALALILIAVVAYLSLTQQGEPVEIRNVVTDFGENLQDVSLLAPAADISQAMDSAYAQYVSPALLAAWKSEPEQAPGRFTSSPWPDRIEIDSVSRQTDGSYLVTARVVEAASTGDTQPFPVLLTLQKIGDSWLITDFSGYPPASQ